MFSNNYRSINVIQEQYKCYCTFLWGNLVTWTSKKKFVVARSSVEVYFRSLTQGTCELMLLRRLKNELKLQSENPMLLYFVKRLTINIPHNPTHHDQTKHIEVY